MYRRQIKYLKQNEPDITIRELLKKWLIPKKWQHFFRVQEDVLINGTYHPFNTIVKNKDIITLNFNFPPRSENQTYLPGHHPVDVCYEDDDIIVVNKKAGIKSHPNLKAENDSLMNDVENYLAPQAHPYMVHRIDMETSGLMLISKTPYLVPIFDQQLSSKTLHREYLAIVKLNEPISERSGIIDDPIGLDPNDKRKRMVRQDGQKAITIYNVIKQNKKYALLQLNLSTGRTHQLRVHLSNKKWPIVNDLLYNPEPKNGNLLLFAHELNFITPFSDDIQTVEADLPDFMTDFITNEL
ncbi:RluA family pseudouridine synthase [Companilactobacillus jidongensis]|uniref:RluA family pseudouridine synthase n=1 Tax=Companilactobacillus jidongensis TaxID=2486006 RepID=UPI000F79EAC7|nr:RluA family pseudouridine synthase [Companilactobacillus jidongensis]